jgi:aldose 1-epimerase
MQDSNWFNLDRKAFQQDVNSKQTDLYILKNKNGLEAAITNYGGRLVALSAPDNGGRLADVVLGFKSLDNYLLATERYHGAVIGRVCNRITNARVRIEGNTYNLIVNKEGVHIHGGPEGFHDQVWDVSNVSDNRLHLHYFSRDGEMGYPGNLKVHVCYELSDNNALTVRFKAHTDKATVVNMTFHPYFNLGGEGCGSINDHILRINADRFTAIDKELMQTGESMGVDGTPFDFRKERSIGTYLEDERTNSQMRNGKGYDHNYILNDPSSGVLTWAAIVSHPASGRCMEIQTSAPALQFYSGNGLDGTDTGKNGRIYDYREALALEPQYFPDAPNQPHFPSITLHGEDVYFSEITYLFRSLTG